MGRFDDFDGGWAPYVSVAQRQRQARQKIAALAKAGHPCQPVVIEGRAIAKTFWGKAWCDNLESYSDYANRLPRGRSYLRNGSVIDLGVETGQVRALVSGSEVYRVEIDVQPLPKAKWNAIVAECAGKVASLIELLQGRLSQAVMQTVTRHGEGLFPQPREIRLRCSCPDSATMCKHVAATLYGVGAQLDAQPELLFMLRHVDPQELIRHAGTAPPPGSSVMPGALDDADLSALFGIDLGDGEAAPGSATADGAAPSRAAAASPTQRPARGAAHARSAAPVSHRKGKDEPEAVVPRPALDKQTGRGRRRKTVTAGELIARGVPRHMIQNWIVAGVLLRTEQRGVYRTTAQSERRIVAYLAARV
jgi:hypothetical protein